MNAFAGYFDFRRLVSTNVMVLLCLCFLACFSVSAEEPVFAPAPQARALTILDGLDLGNVNTIMQSTKGLIWLGTDHGLIRFDGYNAKRFESDRANKYSLSANRVTGIVEDKQQNLWISTFGGGLNRFTPATERFEKIDIRLSSGDKTFTDILYGLSLDLENTLWLATETGVKRLDVNSQKALELPKALAMLPNAMTNQIFIDSTKNIWISSLDNGVYWYNQNKLIHFTADKRGSTLASNNVHQVSEDGSGNIWLGTSQGIHRFNPNTQSFNHFVPSFDSAFKIPGNDIRAITADHKGQLWLGTKANGVHLYLPKSEQFRSITGERDLYQQFNRKSINHIFTDQQSTLWLATEQGIILVSKTALDFQYLTNAKTDFTVSDVKPLKDSIALVGGYQYYDYDQKNHTAKSRFVDDNRLYRVVADDSGLWLATLGQGLQRFSYQNNQLQQIQHAKPTLTDIPMTGLFDAFVDSNKRLWLLPFPDLPHLAGGIVEYDWTSGNFQTYLEAPFISDILQLSTNELLLSSGSAGLLTLDTDTKIVTDWQKTISSTPKRIFTVFKDSKNTLWVGTREQGLARFDSKSKKFSFYTTADGLLSNNIFSIVEDNQQNLWLGTDNSLSRFDPTTGQITNLQKRDGLLFSTFYKRAGAKTDNGTILMGSEQGLVSFNPNDFVKQAPAATVIINDFKLLNRSVDWQNNEVDSPLTQPIGMTDSLELTHEDYMFSFSFAALEYIRPDKIQFAYKMEGLNKQWLYTSAAERVASYTTLSPGDYTFMVKATNRDGQWSEHATTINVTVLPPWWLSWQAYIIYLLGSLACIYCYIQFRTQKLVKRAAALEQNVTERTQELQTSRDQVSDLLSQKQQLFASVSHEFRTPLTLILSPIEYLLSDKKGQHITKELSLIKRNGRRLLRMVDQLLEFAKLEMHDNSQMEQVSLKQTLDIIVPSFEPLVKSKNIQLSLSDYDDVTLSMLPDSLNKIMINILSNAFKYSGKDSKITVLVTNRTGWVDIAISDTGIGISESDVEVVFQRFNRATHGHSEAVPGAGIGLALVKELVEANQGEITLTSVVKQGSTFTVTLPVAGVAPALGGATNTSMQEVIHEHLDLEIDSVTTSDPLVVNNTSLTPDSTQKSVLIVDDNPDLRELLYQQLNGQYQCLLAENGQVGLDIAKEQLPDLVISDVMMPVMDGYQLTRSLKSDQLTSHIPIILLTAKGSMESRLKGLQLLVDDYLAKPFNIEELTLRIYNILTIRDIVKQRYKQVIDEVNPQPQMDKLSVNEVEQAFITRVNEQLATNHTDPDFNAKILSKALSVSERQLQRKLKAQFDLGFPELLRSYRLNKAIEMLNAGQRVSQIFHIVGFSSHSYFSSCFKAKFGKTPKEHQQGE